MTAICLAKFNKTKYFSEDLGGKIKNKVLESCRVCIHLLSVIQKPKLKGHLYPGTIGIGEYDTKNIT